MELIRYGEGVGIIQEVVESVRQKQRRSRRRRTDKGKVKVRSGKGGKDFRYIGVQEAYKWLDENYPIFSIEAGEVKELAGTVNVLVRLEVIDENGIKRVVQRWGTKEAIVSQGNLVMGQYIKAAESDGLKRCVVALGGFNDIYYDVDVVEEVEDEDKERLIGILMEVREVIGDKAIYETVVKYDRGAITMKQIMDKVEKIKRQR